MSGVRDCRCDRIAGLPPNRNAAGRGRRLAPSHL